MLPAPRHLIDCTQPLPERAGEYDYAGHVKCKCGCDTYDLYHMGATHEYQGETIPCTAEIDGQFYFRVVARCTACGMEHLLFDMNLHGWNGFVCREELALPGPRPARTSWPCRTCGGSAHQAEVVVHGEDLESAIENSDGILDESKWQEGFLWIVIDIHCTACGDHPKTWMSCKTT